MGYEKTNMPPKQVSKAFTLGTKNGVDNPLLKAVDN
jgi:hypothetical protein